MNNDMVVKCWIDGKPAHNPRRSLTTDGASLYSYDLLIGGTTPDGVKHVLIAFNVSLSTTDHVYTALYVSRGAAQTVTPVDGDGLTLATMRVFPHDLLVTFVGHENDPESLPTPDPVRNLATDYHPGATVEWREGKGKGVKSTVTGVMSLANGNTRVYIRTPLETGGSIEQNGDVTSNGEIVGTSGARLVVTKRHLTRVLFRVWNNPDGNYGKPKNGVIALLIDETASPDPRHCASFEHVGQHSAADAFEVVRATRRANKAEYMALWRELESAPYYYRLELRQRYDRSSYQRRAAQLRAALP